MYIAAWITAAAFIAWIGYKLENEACTVVAGAMLFPLAALAAF